MIPRPNWWKHWKGVIEMYCKVLLLRQLNIKTVLPLRPLFSCPNILFHCYWVLLIGPTPYNHFVSALKVVFLAEFHCIYLYIVRNSNNLYKHGPINHGRQLPCKTITYNILPSNLSAYTFVSGDTVILSIGDFILSIGSNCPEKHVPY